MKLLVIGGGGREHALAWRLAQSPRVQKIYVAPGNGGTARELAMENLPITGLEELARFAADEGIAFTVVGPEAPLAAGIVDLFRSRELPIFGPTRAAAQLESSKDFAKSFMRRHAIPTADYQTFTDAQAARDYVAARGAPIVVKADGLAAGKGVVVAQTVEQAQAAIDAMLGDAAFGEAGSRVVIEDFLVGEEASFIVMADGSNVLTLATSQDHKRLLDGDQGPNTGGMGAYSPASLVTPEIYARVLREIIRPTIEGMAAEGIAFTGFLYAGLMIDAAGKPRALEFNCRLGDPEAQPIMMRIKSDFATVIEHAIAGTLDEVELEWDRRTALGVVMSAHGYPSQPRKGDRIDGLPDHSNSLGTDTMVFHAGTVERDGHLLTSGGRVLCITVLADSVKMAQHRAYEVLQHISFDGMHFRRDIGHRAIARRAESRQAQD